MPVLLPADIERAEREKIARKRPWLAFSRPADDPRPDPDMFAWKDPAKLWEAAR